MGKQFIKMRGLKLRCEDVIVPDTGEYILDAIIQTREELELRQEKNVIFFRNKKINKDFSEEYGNFYLAIFTSLKRYHEELSPDVLTRLIYAVSFIDYQGYLKLTQKTKMTVSDLKIKMKLSDKVFRNWFREVTSNHILQIDNLGHINVNPTYFFKGSKRLTDGIAMRMKIDVIRQLYEQALPKMHKSLGYIYRMIPFVNIEHNILCKNPFEKEIENIRFLTLGELCESIGLQRQNLKRLVNILLEYQIDNECIIKFDLDKKIYINPKVYYLGSLDSLKNIQSF